MLAQDRLGIVIVNYRTPDLTIRCVQSILRNKLAKPSDIIVVENGSNDDSFSRINRNLPDIHIIESESNRGFGGGVNLGISNSQREFVLVANPDTYFSHEIMQAIYFLDNNTDVGVVGLDLVYPGNERQYSGRRFYTLLDIFLRRSPLGNKWPFRGRVEEHLMKEYWGSEEPFDAEWVMGAAFIVRRDVYTLIGGMDERYFLYLEDVDMCARVWRAGYRVVCIPGVTAVHDHQRTSASGVSSWAARRHLESLLLFRTKFRVPIVRRPGIAGLWR
jgi:N-acetylglucosaminyl-diphospho-decaprenol L-rhamnosyltransferase